MQLDEISRRASPISGFPKIRTENTDILKIDKFLYKVVINSGTTIMGPSKQRENGNTERLQFRIVRF